MSSTIALGFRAHTGWAAMVAVSGAPPDIKVLDRRRIELLPLEASPAALRQIEEEIPRFVYHEASNLDLHKAESLVRRAVEIARRSAAREVKTIVEELRRAGSKVTAAAVPGGSTKIPADLKAILASHALIHAAEGELFRQALASAAETCGLRVTIVRERDVWPKAASALGLEIEVLRQQIAALGKSLGPPWSEDQKIAPAAALLAT